MIVKVQISQNDGGQHVLIYNQDRSVMKHYETPPEVKELLEGTPKAYFHAEVAGKELTLTERAPAQDW